MTQQRKSRATKATPKKRHDWRPAFIEHLAKGGTVTEAAEAAGVHRATTYRELDANPTFAAAFKDAEKRSADLLESAARRRAVDGVERLKFHEGEAVNDPRTGEVYVEREYGDTLLIFLLKHRNPEVFGDRVHVDGDLTLRTPADGVSAATQLLAEIREVLGVDA